MFTKTQEQEFNLGMFENTFLFGSPNQRNIAQLSLYICPSEQLEKY